MVLTFFSQLLQNEITLFMNQQLLLCNRTNLQAIRMRNI